MMGRRSISRRAFVTQGSGLALSSALAMRMVHANPLETPIMTSGVMTGDVLGNSAVVWSRCDRAARMMVEWSTDPMMKQARTLAGPIVQADTDFAGKLLMRDLPNSKPVFYRTWFVSPDGGESDPIQGSFGLPHSDSDDVFFAWSGDTAGQGFGINPEWGGMKMYGTIEKVRPQFFVHCGDMIYADNPIPAELQLNDGSLWKNTVTPAKSKAAVTVDDFRGNYAYNLMDTHVRSFHAHVPQYVMWDDHEVNNNWYPTQELALRKDGKAYEFLKYASELAERAKQAFFEYTPIASGNTDRRIYRSISRGPLVDLFLLDLRSYRGPNTENKQAVLDGNSAILGAEQLSWLKKQLRESRAVWKVLCCDMPLGVIVGDGMEGKTYYEAVANGDGNAPSGRELEVADLLSWMKQASIQNAVWITADIHYAAAHYYNPQRAVIKDSFLPFWEFVAGPLHAGTFGPGELDGTFGPEVKFENAPKKGTKLPVAPNQGLQSFGTIRVDAASKRMTIELRGLDGRAFPGGTFELEPQGL